MLADATYLFLVEIQNGSHRDAYHCVQSEAESHQVIC